MAEPDNLTLVYLRRLDAKMDAMSDNLNDLKARFTTLEIQVSHLAATEASHYAHTAIRLDKIEHRLERHADVIPA